MGLHNKQLALNPINRNIAYLMAQKNFTIQKLSELAGIGIGTVQKLLTDPTCNPTLSSLEAIAKTLGVTVAQLIADGKIGDVSILHKIPVLTFDDLNNLFVSETITQERLNNFANSYVDVSSNINSTSTFAVRLLNNAMPPVFPVNSLLIFDHQKKFYDNAYVLVKMVQHNIIAFKQLLIDEPAIYLKSVKASFQDNLTKLDPQDIIVATLVQSQINH